jgi:DNA-binding SARP family transcriptional activator/tetratricopeptide (TPR) repeat protein
VTRAGTGDPRELRVEVLGAVRAFRGGGELDLGPPRQRAVLAMLALRANRVVTRDELVDGGWGTDPPASVVNRVHAHVAALRRVVEPDRPRRAPGQVLASVGSGYRLALVPGHLDAEVFAARLDSARRLGATANALAAFDAALGLWRGTALADIPGPFAEAERVRLGELRVTAAEERAAVILARGADPDLIPDLSALAVEHPLRERVRALLMIALYRAGRAAEALTVYADTRRLLVEELGVEPGPRLQRLHLDILAEAELGPEHLGDAPPPARVAAAGPVPRQLPPPPRHFAGRRAELRALTRLMTESAGPGRTVVVSAIDGTAGIGKTTLAVYWAHGVVDRFPDGQLYVNLRGFDPAGTPMEPGEALRGFLDALGVPPPRVPYGLDAQAGLYRTLLADRRILVVLDNAADVSQVLPLLPSSPTALVLVTSRNRLTSLVAAQGAHPLALDLLSPAEAHELLARHLGPARMAAEPAAVTEIVQRCAQLPLALSILAARAATQPEVPLAALVAELDAARSALDAFDTGDRAMDVRTVFSWSYRRLDAGAARLFRLLGTHPGPDVGIPAAASLAGVPMTQVRAQLAELARAHLVEEHTPDRYRCHDLLRTYATELSRSADTEAERRAATHRVLDHYLHTATAAALLLYPHRHPIDVAPPQPGVAPAELGTVTDALAWFGAEHAVLMAAVDRAAADGFDTHAWQLPQTLTHYLERSGHWYDWLSAQRVALAATRRLADPAGQARIHRSLAGANARLGRFDEAHAQSRQALDLFRALGDRIAEANVHADMAQVYGLAGRYREAVVEDERALDLHRAIGNRIGEASALNGIGWYAALLGDHERALACCQAALAVQVELGDRHGQGNTLDSIGYAQHHLGRYGDAVASYEGALAALRETGDRYNEAVTLGHLGDTRAAAGDQAAARASWEQALAVLDDLDHPDAAQFRAKLGELDRVP